MFFSLTAVTEQAVSTIPVSQEYFGRIFFIAVIVVFTLFAVGAIFSKGFAADEESGSVKNIILALILDLVVVAVAVGLVFLVIKIVPGDVNAEKTEKSIQTQYGISYSTPNMVGIEDFFKGDEKKTIPITDVTLITGESYSNGAIMSSDGEITVYVFDDDTKNPIPLELLKDSTLFSEN